MYAKLYNDVERFHTEEILQAAERGLCVHFFVFQDNVFTQPVYKTCSILTIYHLTFALYIHLITVL